MDRRGPLIFSALLSLTFLASLLSVILLSQGVAPIGPVIGAPPLQLETLIPPVLGGPSGGGGPLDVPFPSLVGDGSGSGPVGTVVVAVGGPGVVPVGVPPGDGGPDEEGDGGPPPGVVPKQEDPPPGDDDDDLDDPTGDDQQSGKPRGKGNGHNKGKGKGHHQAKGQGHDGDSFSSAGSDATGHHGKPKKAKKAKKR